ncbi:MAG: hypothetical protein PHI32_15605 [Dysgonamonadaceae bacterium]|nr:hypothetical protein [Dysgonamonadaceae bacterium]MDD4681380.1 hypothetical protein [Clostridia bacterium]
MDLYKAIAISKQIQEEISSKGIEPQEGIRATTWKVVPIHLYRNTRGYIEKIGNQINSCYEHGCYDACAVMIRRFMENLIIEAFIKMRIENKIKDKDGNFFFLDCLIDNLLNEPSFSLSRNTKVAYRKLKILGDKAAHGRMQFVSKDMIDKNLNNIIDTFTELLYIADLKRN